MGHKAVWLFWCHLECFICIKKTPKQSNKKKSNKQNKTDNGELSTQFLVIVIAYLGQTKHFLTATAFTLCKNFWKYDIMERMKPIIFATSQSLFSFRTNTISWWALLKDLRSAIRMTPSMYTTPPICYSVSEVRDFTFKFLAMRLRCRHCVCPPIQCLQSQKWAEPWYCYYTINFLDWVIRVLLRSVV